MSFEIIKEYLHEPPILVPPVEGRPLIMYLIMLDNSMGFILGQQHETGRKEYAIYYLSKKFTGCDSRYSMLEKTCCALAWAVKHLRQYMLKHTTWLYPRWFQLSISLKSLLLLEELPIGKCCCLNMLLNTILKRLL